MQRLNEAITDYWAKHYQRRGICTLCGNTGRLDTTGVKTPAGWLVGRVDFCFCPNGQLMRTAHEVSEEPPGLFGAAHRIVDLGSDQEPPL